MAQCARVYVENPARVKVRGIRGTPTDQPCREVTMFHFRTVQPLPAIALASLIALSACGDDEPVFAIQDIQVDTTLTPGENASGSMIIEEPGRCKEEPVYCEVGPLVVVIALTQKSADGSIAPGALNRTALAVVRVIQNGRNGFEFEVPADLTAGTYEAWVFVQSNVGHEDVRIDVTVL